MTITLSIGITDFHFTPTYCCIKNEQLETLVSLSVRLHGDFMKAAISDNLSDTVDYETLCHHLERTVRLQNCDQFIHFAEQIKNAIIGFSPLIKGGYIFLNLLCHGTFTIEKGLDIVKDSCL